MRRTISVQPEHYPVACQLMEQFPDGAADHVEIRDWDNIPLGDIYMREGVGGTQRGMARAFNWDMLAHYPELIEIEAQHVLRLWNETTD